MMGDGKEDWANKTVITGEYQKYTAPPLAGSRPKIGYISIWPVNHQLIATVTQTPPSQVPHTRKLISMFVQDKQGGEQPAIAWESMTAAARSAIENTNFGDATPSFRDGNFMSYLADAFV